MSFLRPKVFDRINGCAVVDIDYHFSFFFMSPLARMLLKKENKIFMSVIQFNCLEKKITGNFAVTICNIGSIEFTRSGLVG